MAYNKGWPPERAVSFVQCPPEVIMRRVLFFLPVLMSLMISTASFGTQYTPDTIRSRNMAEASSDSAYVSGLNLLAGGRYAEARSRFAESLKTNPSDIHSMLGIAETFSRTGSMKQAEEWIRKAITEKADDPWAQESLARLHFEKGNRAAAEGAFLKTIALNPNFIQSHLGLGELFLSDPARTAEGIAAFKRAIALQPNHAGAHYAIGTAYFRTKDYPGALKYLSLAEKLDKTNPLPSMVLAKTHLEQGHYGLAIASVDQALFRKENYAAAHLLRGKISLLTQKPADALEAFEKAVSFDPMDLEAQLLLGTTQHSQGDYAAAEKTYRKILNHDDRLGLVCNNLAWVLLEQDKELAQALDWANRATLLSPENANFKDTLAWVHAVRGEYAKARKIYEALIPPRGGDPAVRYHLAVVYARLSKPEKAVPLLTQSMEEGLGGKEHEAAVRLLDTLRQQ